MRILYKRAEATTQEEVLIWAIARRDLRRRIDMETCSYTLSHGWLGGTRDYWTSSQVWVEYRKKHPAPASTHFHYKLDLCLLRFDPGNRLGLGQEMQLADRSGSKSWGKAKAGEMRANWHQNFDLQRAGPGQPKILKFHHVSKSTKKLVKVQLLRPHAQRYGFIWGKNQGCLSI